MSISNRSNSIYFQENFSRWFGRDYFLFMKKINWNRFASEIFLHKSKSGKNVKRVIFHISSCRVHWKYSFKNPLDKVLKKFRFEVDCMWFFQLFHIKCQPIQLYPTLFSWFSSQTIPLSKTVHFVLWISLTNRNETSWKEKNRKLSINCALNDWSFVLFFFSQNTWRQAEYLLKFPVL